MDTMVAVKFWMCSKQLHQGRRCGGSLAGCSNEVGWRHMHRRGCRMDAQWSAHKNTFHFKHHLSIWTMLLPPLHHHCASSGRPIASIERSLWRPLCLHSATTAMLEPPQQCCCLNKVFIERPVVSLRQFSGSRKAQGWCCGSYTETGLSVFRRPVGVLIIFLVIQRCGHAWKSQPLEREL